jgi:hypothetical protein
MYAHQHTLLPLCTSAAPVHQRLLAAYRFRLYARWHALVIRHVTLASLLDVALSHSLKKIPYVLDDNV